MKNIDISGLSESKAVNGSCKSKHISYTRSYKHILAANIFSLFNIVNIAVAIVLLEVGSVKNCLFMIPVISNTFIGIIQEIRSKRIIDKLAIVNQSAVNVIRNGQKRKISVNKLEKNDIIELKRGCQITNDCVIVNGSCEVNEALLTGESDSLFKREGEKLLSGSFVVSGSCLCRILCVGSENYADSLLGQIKYVKTSHSEIREVLRRIIVVISACIIPMGGLLFYNQYSLSHSTLKEAVESSAAALIGMIPEGLVLLVSTVFAMGVVRLSKRNVLSQDLYSLESLARTDVLCLDKTGTITTGEMIVERLQPVTDNYEELETLVKVIAAYSQDGNETINAIKKYFKESIESNVRKTIPFSSERKWSAVCSSEFGNIIMGSAEMIFQNADDYFHLNDADEQKYRAVAVAVTNSEINDYVLPANITLKGYILLKEIIRDNVKEIFKYFDNEDVAIKIISGDNPATVKKLCTELFEKDYRCVDLSAVSEDEIPSLTEDNNIFGRATPQQKKTIITALKNRGHTVGMVGDGVNDVLALKESDCSIALSNGSSAARDVSRLVLLDSDFSSLPEVVSEGRRSVNNLQNSASLFLTKTIFSTIMTLLFIFIDYPYPFTPVQMSLVSCLTIGLPSFLLSFLRNNNRIKGSFLENVFKKSLPAASANIVSVLSVVIFAEKRGLAAACVSTLCLTALAVTGVALIVMIYKPLTPLKVFVISLSITGFAAAFLLFADFLGLARYSLPVFLNMCVVGLADAALIACFMNVCQKKTYFP